MAEHAPGETGLAWWGQREVFYQIYPRSSHGSDGDGNVELTAFLPTINAKWYFSTARDRSGDTISGDVPVRPHQGLIAEYG